MGYWKTEADKLTADVSAHPWATLLDTSLEKSDPELHAQLSDRGELDAYIAVKVSDAIAEYDDMIASGMDKHDAKSEALESLLPSEDDEPEDWEIEGAEEDAVAAFAQVYGGDEAQRMSLQPGTKKNVNGVEYTLNENHRWTNAKSSESRPKSKRSDATTGSSGSNWDTPSSSPVDDVRKANDKILSDTGKKPVPTVPEIAYRMAESNGDSPKHRQARKIVAKQFLQEHGLYFDWNSGSMKPLDQNRIDGMMEGIDFSKPVVMGPPPSVPPPQKMAQWQAAGGMKGGYFAPEDTTPDDLGLGMLATAWSLPGQPVMPREQKLYSFDENSPMVYIRSVAAPIVDTWGASGIEQPAGGGGLQWFVPEAADPNVDIREAV